MKTSKMIPPPFQDQVFRKDFKAGERGVFVAIKSNILASQINNLNTDTMWGKIEIRGTRPSIVASVYRHTDTDPTSMETTQLYYWEVEWYITECSYNWWLQCPKCRLVIPGSKQQPSIWANSKSRGPKSDCANWTLPNSARTNSNEHYTGPCVCNNHKPGEQYQSIPWHESSWLCHHRYWFESKTL